MDSVVFNWPRISIILGNFNYDRWIERAIVSVLDQGYPNLEFLVIDDGSTDKSVTILEKYTSSFQYWNPRNNLGHYSWIKEASDRATGDLINWLCSDDFLAVGALKKIGLAYRQKQYDLIVGKAASWNESNQFENELEPQVPSSFEEIFKKGFVLPQPSTFIRTELFKRALPPPGLVDIVVDTATYLKLWLEYDSQLTYLVLPDVLAHVQNHQKSQTASQGHKRKEEIKKVYSFLASETEGVRAKLLSARERLHHFLDCLETIASRMDKGLWSLIQLFFKYPKIILVRAFWGAALKKMRCGVF